MLVKKNVGLGKKAIAGMIVTIILILLAISAVFVLWSTFNNVILQSPIDENCLDFVGISVEKACYLINEGENKEIKVVLKNGGFGDGIVREIDFLFLPSDSLWVLSGEKCSDARLENREYGGYCDILERGEEFSYVFNVNSPDLDVQDKVKVYVSGNRISCFAGEKEIKASC